MDEKDLELEKDSAETSENISTEISENENAQTAEKESTDTSESENADTSENEENENRSEVKYEENDNWQFEASAPTLESNIDIGGGYQIDNINMPSEQADTAESEGKSRL